jgi:hypothetical protein
MITSSKLKNYNIQDFKIDNIYTMAVGVIIFGENVFMFLCNGEDVIIFDGAEIIIFDRGMLLFNGNEAGIPHDDSLVTPLELFHDTHPLKEGRAYKLLGIFLDVHLTLYHIVSKLTKSFYETSKKYYTSSGDEGFIFRTHPFTSSLQFLSNEHPNRQKC